MRVTVELQPTSPRRVHARARVARRERGDMVLE